MSIINRNEHDAEQGMRNGPEQQAGSERTSKGMHASSAPSTAKNAMILSKYE